MNMMKSKDVYTDAPAIFSLHKHPQRTDGYNFISTENIVELFKKNNWFLQSAQQTKTYRNASAIETLYKKHMLTFRNPHIKKIDGIVPTIVVLNSHDGTSCFEMMLGLYRVVSESLFIISEEQFKPVKFRHSKIAKTDIEIGIIKIERSVPLINNMIKQMDETRMTIPDAIKLASNIRSKVWENPVVELSLLLMPRRDEDDTNTLWKVANVIQENIMCGGIPGRTPNNRKTRTKGISNIDRQVEVNHIVWEEMQNYLKEKK